MGILHIVLPILVGGIIGYCTNYIAIKMLFHPHKAVYIGKHKLPFTPGIIPKNQKRLAGAIGDAVSEQLLTKEAVLESFGESGEKYISQISESICNSDKSIVEMLPEGTESEEVIESASAALSKSIMAKVEQLDMDAIIVQIGQQAVNSFIGKNPMLGMLFNSDMQNKIFDKLGNAAREYLNEHGEEALKGFVSEYIKELADKPLGELVSGLEDRERLQTAIESAIKGAAAKHGTGILDQIDIKEIVAQRVEAMEVDELEELVLSVMKQELQSVINLGAVIGAIIGIVNIFL